MIPITRKELYLNKIVGNNEYETPEKPISEEEFFFAEILGEAVQAPEPLTRYQIYLAKIAGKDVEIPYPETRLEYFLAKACGMDIETPTPITREEIFWSNYTAIVEFEVEGVPPLTYKAIEGTLENYLENYRIYGNTVGGESVGDRTGNLFDKNTIISNKVITEYGTVTNNINYFVSNFISVKAGDYTLSLTNSYTSGGSSNRALWFDVNKENPILVLDYYAVRPVEVIKILSIQADGYIQLSCRKTDENVMLNLGSTALPYEPYGYKVPITVTNSGTTSNETIYLPEPIKMVGSEAEYVDYAEQKMHRIGADDLDVTLPALPILSGTNTLTVGTEVQPSKVCLKGKIEEIPTRTVSYYSQDGSTLLGTETVESGGNASGLQDTPTKPDTEQYTYTFVGWSNTTNATTAMSGILNNITADKSVYAAFSETEKTFTVTFYNGAELIYTAQNVSYNGTAVYSGTTPTKAETSEYTYTFAGWNTNSSASTADADALTNVTADRTVYAIFTAVSKGYTVYFYNGETLLETVTGVQYGGTATYTGSTPTKSGHTFTGWFPSNTNITADTACYAQFAEDEMYESITDTWSQIIANIGNGTYSTKYHIGDTKKIDLGTEGEVIMTIVGIDADDLADDSGKAPITWISKQLLKTDHRMNPARQSGASGTGTLGGWEACEMRSYLINTIKPLLPSEVRNALKTVKKYSRIYSTSGTAVNNVVSNDDIWIPSAYEMNFTGNETSGVTYSTAFPNIASRIKHKVGGSAAWWWLRSAANTSHFRVGGNDGSGYYNNASSSFGVAVGFVI